MKLLFEDKIKTNKADFIAKVKEIANKLHIKPDWLMAAMYRESGFKHNIVNEIGAVGLIQFLPLVYESWGLDETDLSSMTNVQQLDYVYKYIYNQNKIFNNGGKIKSYVELHTLIFFPAAVDFKKKEAFEVKSLSASKVAKSNKAIDLNKDSEITKKEFEKFLKQRFSEDLSKLEKDRLFSEGIYNPLYQGLFIIGFASAIFGYYIYRQITK